jgi:jumonji domain-containing protein 7
VAKLFSTQIFPPTFPFAEEAFGTGPPDAINLWVGNERSVSSMHKDHYENLFYVCSGQKEFVLCPPADAPFLHENLFAIGTFSPSQSSSEDQHGPSWIVVADNKQDDDEDKSYKTNWIEPDILTHLENGDQKFPLLSRAHPIKIIVSEGEMLYIPSLWYHRVTQTCETVGVNYWFDMKFDGPTWCYFNLLQHSKISISEN